MNPPSHPSDESPLRNGPRSTAVSSHRTMEPAAALPPTPDRRQSLLDFMWRSRSLMVATSAVVEGIPDEQKTSPVRRVYCLLCLFDLICIFIVWIIYVNLISTDISSGLKEQVVEFQIQTSMFDVVMLALLRLLIQELAYGILKSWRPWWTALSTTITCAYLLVKIFFYDFKHTDSHKNSSNVMDYLLMLSSFVICWAETWFLDFRVLPKEKAARQLTLEASSLLEDDQMRSGHRGYRTFDPRDRFFSPVGSTPITASRYSTARPTAYHSLSGSPVPGDLRDPETDALMFKAGETFDQACSLYADGREWTHEKGDAIQGCVYSRRISRRAKIYKLEVLLPISSEKLYRDFVDDVEETPTWNSTVISARRVQRLSPDTDVLYTVSTDTMKGAVSARDCLMVRRWSQISPRLYLVANQSVEHRAVPTDRRYVRAINGVGLTAFEELAGMENQCKFTWILNTNLKGWLPQSVVEQAMTMVMLSYLSDLRLRIEQISGAVVDNV